MKIEKNTKKSDVNPLDVGTIISPAYFRKLKTAYGNKFPNTASSFYLHKARIIDTLALSDQITGIRFMYGLEDQLNPNSVRILLIPCLHFTAFNTNPKAAIGDFGYYDHEGRHYQLTEVAQLIANFVRMKVSVDEQAVYKKVTRGSFFGRNSLMKILNDPACEFIHFHFGLQGNVIQPVLEQVDISYQAVSEIYLELSNPCPPFCGAEGDDPCMSKKMIELFSDEAELNVLRKFRDNTLLKLEGGEWFYEMYYFISPLLAALIGEKEDQEAIYKEIYDNWMKPMIMLIKEDKPQEVVSMLEWCFEALIHSYGIEELL